MPIIIILVIIAVIIIGFISIYNSLVTLKNQVANSEGQINTQLQRRFDLIPNLVETVKGYMNHEEAVLTNIAELRTSWAKASSIEEKSNLDNQLSGALKTIMAVSENYPDLKANQNFLELQEQLQNTEDRLAASRQIYNNTATTYNTKLETFPSNVIASMFHFTKVNLFEVDSEEAKKNVKVQF